MIISPRFFALDSSHLGEMARDATRPATRSATFALLRELAADGWLPVLGWHHISELIQHGDDEIVEDRLRFIHNLPAIAWIRPYGSGRHVGTIVDLFAHEVDAAINNPRGNCSEIAREVSSEVFLVGTGAEALASYEDHWDSIRELVFQQQERTRETASLSQFGMIDDSSEPLRDLLEGQRRSPEAAAAVLKQLRRSVTENLASRGDNKLRDPASTAESFVSEVVDEGAPFYSGVDDPISEYLRNLDVDPSELDPDGTRGQLYELAEFRRKLRVLDGQMRVPWKVLRQTNPALIPSWQIQRACRANRAPAPRAKGSDINDVYLACAAPYCERVFVDKRTFESFRRANSKFPAIQEFTGSIRKAATYHDAVNNIRHQQ